MAIRIRWREIILALSSAAAAWPFAARAQQPARRSSVVLSFQLTGLAMDRGMNS